MTDFLAKNQSLLARSILRAYGLTIRAVVKLKTVYGLYCADDTKWILKPAPANETAERLQVLAYLTEQLKRQGLAMAGPIPCRSGEWFTRIQGESWYLQPWLHGRHVNLMDSTERICAAQSLAQLHTGTKEYAAIFGNLFPAASLVRRLTRKEAALRAVWSKACSILPVLGRQEERLFSQMHTAVMAARQLHHDATPTSLVFCHRDLAPHNMLFVDDVEPSVHLIDFDRAGFDLPYLDVIQLCNHSLHFAGPEGNLFRDIVRTYLEVAGNEMSIEGLAGLLTFPDGLVRTVGEWAHAGFPERNQGKVKVAMRHEQRRLVLCERMK
jgi:Ser/Thr protein kinase RdoA (MazF antagonist)